MSAMKTTVKIEKQNSEKTYTFAEIKNLQGIWKSISRKDDIRLVNIGESILFIDVSTGMILSAAESVWKYVTFVESKDSITITFDPNED